MQQLSVSRRRVLGIIGGAWLAGVTWLFATPTTSRAATVAVAEAALRPWVADLVSRDPALAAAVQVVDAAGTPAGAPTEGAAWIGLQRSTGPSGPDETVVAQSPHVVVAWEKSRERLGLRAGDGGVNWHTIQRAVADASGPRFALPAPNTPLGADGLALLAHAYTGPGATSLPAGALEDPGLRAWLRPFYLRQTRVRCDERLLVEDWARYRTTIGDAGLLPECEALTLIPVVEPQARLYVHYPSVNQLRRYVLVTPPATGGSRVRATASAAGVAGGATLAPPSRFSAGCGRPRRRRLAVRTAARQRRALGSPVAGGDANGSQCIGIATYRDMAECLGWPQKEIGFADVLALRADPQGWARYRCAKAEWGQRPLVAYTDPLTSTTGRSVLFTLYAIATGKQPEQLSAEDVTNPTVFDYVKRFQRAVDHYVIGTLPLNTKIFLGPRYGHFFFIPEDNLIHLYEGTEQVRVGLEVKRQPISRPMVMIYPKEGSTVHNHSASIVQAKWVTPAQVEAAKKWIAYLHEEPQQRALMTAGFRPATPLPYTDPISPRYGLDPNKPTVRVNPDRISQPAMREILASWEDVRKPGVVTFVVDVSGSMAGAKIQKAKEGLLRAIDGMGKSNQVGFLTFGDGIIARVPIAPLDANRFPIAGAIEEMQARGNTALYDAIKTGIEMTDAAPGDPDATRGIVVLTDGKANRGRTQLHDLIQMMSRNEVAVREFRGFEADDEAVLEEGAKAGKKELMGTGLALKTRHRILVFYSGDDDPATSPAPPVRPPEDTPRSPPPDGPVNGHATGRQPDRDYPSGLTRREFEVLRLVDRGA